MTISCPSNLVRDDYQDGADRVLDPEVRLHLESCPECRQYLEARAEALNGLDPTWHPHLHPRHYQTQVKTAVAVAAFVAFGAVVGTIGLGRWLRASAGPGPGANAATITETGGPEAVTITETGTRARATEVLHPPRPPQASDVSSGRIEN